MAEQVINHEEVEAKLRAAGVAPKKVLRQAMEAAAEVVQKAANERAPGPNIHYKVVQDKAALVEVDVGPDDDHWYYRFAEFGAGPHRIRTSVKKALTIGDRFSAWANHPGRSARPFLRPALDNNQDRIAQAAGKVIYEALQNVAD